MKKLLTSALLSCFVFCAEAQVTLENIYPNTISVPKFLMFAQLDSSTYKYILFDQQNSQFTIYNLNHSIYLNVLIPITFVSGISQYQIAYVTKSLFDCDTSNIEYALSFLGNGFPTSYPKRFYVYRTNGTQLENIDSVCFMNFSTGQQFGPLYNAPIVNTPIGTKLILRCVDGSTRVYSVCGNLPCAECVFGNGPLLNNGDDVSINKLPNPFPNPTDNSTTIPYTLPEGENTGELVFYDAAGKEIKRFKVDKTFTQIIISSADLAPGTYYYHLQTAKNTSEGKTLVVIK